jgi:NitT/TauT family transport system ATP-binding protein
MSEGQPHISLCDSLTITLGGRLLLDDESLDVTPGTVTVLMGPSGVGKSVLAATLFGVAHGSDIKARGTIGEGPQRGALVFQDSAGIPHLSAARNLQLAGASKAEAIKLCEEFGLEPQRPAWALSGGEGRRLATASALVADRELLWLDEPAAGLDIVRMEQLARELRKQADERNLAVVVTTHRLEFASAIADRLLFLRFDGKLSELEIPPYETSLGRGRSTEEIERLIRVEMTESEQPEKTESSSFQWRRPAWLDWAPELARSAWGLRGAFSRGSVAWWKTLTRALKLGAVEGALFYPFVGAIFGGIFVLIFSLTLPFLDTVQVIEQFGPMVAVRLSPPFAAILVAARSGSAIGSWVGQMSASRQFDTLEVLGISSVRSVTSAAWLGMITAGVVGIFTFAAALMGVFGGYLLAEGGSAGTLFSSLWNEEGFAAALKAGLYSLLVASITIQTARRPVQRPDEVASGITAAIVISTVWVMVSELVILGLELAGV